MEWILDPIACWTNCPYSEDLNFLLSRAYHKEISSICLCILFHSRILVWDAEFCSGQAGAANEMAVLLNSHTEACNQPWEGPAVQEKDASVLETDKSEASGSDWARWCYAHWPPSILQVSACPLPVLVVHHNPLPIQLLSMCSSCRVQTCKMNCYLYSGQRLPMSDSRPCKSFGIQCGQSHLAKVKTHRWD